MLRPGAVPAGLAGALGGYLVLFGPLALFPHLLGTRGWAGPVLTCLPAGFAMAALAAERVLPSRLGSRGRALTGAMVAAAGCAGLLAAPGSPLLAGALLLVTGTGLGAFIPANNSSVMGAIPARMSAAGGGLVNMSRGLGTALGVALVTLCLNAAGGARLALLVLAAAGAGAGLTALVSGGRRGAAGPGADAVTATPAAGGDASPAAGPKERL
jgi:hypothetical protein